VFPVAGRGTRFLPATKASPKEMLPIVDKPLIQYAVEEALAAGARNLVFITGSSKRAIEDHFDSDPELEAALEAQGKQDLLESLRGILPSYAACIYIRQPAPLGLGHAVLCARPVVGHEPFFVHRILDQRAIDDRQHFLGDRLGRRQEAGAEPRDGEDGFLDRLAGRRAGHGGAFTMLMLQGR
jgi:UTP-glucose-1-phosphate uridylyltransferase